MALVFSDRKTSASRANVVVSDQLRTEAVMTRPALEKPSDATSVNGHGPEMHDRRALRNSLPAPASRETLPTEAFHLPSGEQGGCRAQGTFPVLTISK